MTITRRQLLATPLALAATQSGRAEPGSTLFFTSAELERMRAFARRERADFIGKRVKAAMSAGPWSVTYKRPDGLGVDAGPHDYVSEGPYWFPDPANPGGPYIRHDGVRNPNRFLGNANDMRAMTDAVVALGMGHGLLSLPGCADRAAHVLSVYFIDPKTRMNPDLRYGQMVRGRNTGRGTGIIDTACLIQLVHGITLLESMPGFPREVSAGVRQWIGAYADWMNTSKPGLDEKKSGNNHATWWTAQFAAYKTFAFDRNARLMAWDHYRDYLVPTEIQPDGSCPKEEARTKSLSYSAMNLDAFAIVCRIAQVTDGVDLWHYRTKAGIGVAKAFDYLLPFMEKSAAWKKEQIDEFDAATHYFTGLAGLAIPSEKLLGAYLAQPRSEGTWAQVLDILIRSAKG